MSRRGDFEYVSDIVESIKRIEIYTKAFSYRRLAKDIKTQDAVIRNLEIIGEATKNLSAGFRRKHKGIDWKAIAGMRDKLIHHYFGVNWKILWDAIRNKLPGLKGQIQVMIGEGKKERKSRA